MAAGALVGAVVGAVVGVELALLEVLAFVEPPQAARSTTRRRPLANKNNLR
jgi:hypothetical protein